MHPLVLISMVLVSMLRVRSKFWGSLRHQHRYLHRPSVQTGINGSKSYRTNHCDRRLLGGIFAS